MNAFDMCTGNTKKAREMRVANPRENLLTHQSTESEMKKTDRDLCVCGNCSEMPTKEEQVCCGTFKGWKKRFKSGVIMTSFAISIAIKINS